MAITVSVEELLKQQVVESSRIEYKKDFNPTTIVHSICAFANDIDNIGGGYILIGVDECDGIPKLPIQGIAKERVDGILKKLLELCHFIEPLYEPQVEPIRYKDNYVIVVKVSGGHGRPYKAPKDATSRQSNKYYYIRKFSSSVIASADEEKELFYMSSDIPFDDRPNLLASPDVLNRALMRDYLKEVKSSLYTTSEQMDTLEIAASLQLLDGPPEDLKPLNVGLLLFSEHPEKYFRYARIEIAYIPEPTGRNMVERTFSGPIHYQLRDALSYLQNNVIEEKIIKVANRAEADRFWNYPFTALEEILANAVYHRSYQIHEPITVTITNEAIEIISFPGFDRSISDEDISKYHIRARRYRNRRLGDFLKELHLIEGRNTGFPNAINALAANGSPNLQFHMSPDRGYLSVIIPIHRGFLSQRKQDKKALYEDKISSCLPANGLTLTELAKAMGYKSITAKLRQTVQAMINENKLQRIMGKSNNILIKKLDSFS